MNDSSKKEGKKNIGTYDESHVGRRWKGIVGNDPKDRKRECFESFFSRTNPVDF
jgi:hypothetical protein